MFKDYSNKKGKTANTLLKEYVFKCINETMERDVSGSPPTAATHAPEESKATGTPMPHPEPTIHQLKQEKHYQPFTDADASRVDLPELLTNVKYQLDIATSSGMDVLAALMEKARQQEESQKTTKEEPIEYLEF